jgi:HD-GYP domain-containing protein (c-di-GMP phosphodiesterase class II)
MSTLSRLQRAIHEFIDAMGEDRRTVLALAAIRSKKDYLTYHSINVMILSILVGREFGMKKRHLSDLGMAAVLHDIGKIQISSNILEKKVSLEEDEWKQLKKSNTYSLMQLIQLRGFNESALRRMLVAYEHTMTLEDTQKGRKPILFSRIVAVTHCYDAMTTSQSYRDALLPNEALKLMKKEEGKKFDPAILRIFLRIMTIYPPGALVLLNTKEVAMVADSSESRQDPAKPKVKLLYTPQGNKLPAPEVDLFSDPKGRAIVKSLDAEKYRVNPLLYLLPKVPA